LLLPGHAAARRRGCRARTLAARAQLSEADLVDAHPARPGQRRVAAHPPALPHLPAQTGGDLRDRRTRRPAPRGGASRALLDRGGAAARSLRGQAGSFGGRWTRNSVDVPGMLRALTLPPCASTMSRTIARPNPEPLECAPLTKRSKIRGSSSG